MAAATLVQNPTPQAFNIEEFLAAEESKGLLRLTTAGSVDDGKSTLIGRLLHDAKGAYEDQLKSAVRGGQIDFSLLTDGLRAEREQGITIDVAYRYFATIKRKFILADTPGHEQYTRNMATGASTAELAIILLDAHRGLTTQSRRHAFIATMLAIPNFVIAVNKMDLVGYDQEVFNRLRAEFEPFLERIGAKNYYFLPLSALKGDNVVDRGSHMPWFDGPPLLEYLETVDPADNMISAPFRMAVQRVVRPDQTFRGFSGQIASGTIRPGDEIQALPSGRRSKVKRVVTFDGDLEMAHAPQSVTLTLADEIDISRGDMISSGTPPKSAKIFDATMVWFDAHPLDPAHDYLIKHTSHTVAARVDGVRHLVNVATLDTEPATSLAMNEIGVVRIATAKPLFFDPYQENRVTGSFILIDRKTNHTAGAGMILAEAEGSLEDAADRLVRLVRAAVPEGSQLNLPSDDAQAMEVVRGLLKGVFEMNVATIESKAEQAQELISKILENASAPCITSSFQSECVVLVHMLLAKRPNIPVLFLETGYHFPETIEYRDKLTAEWKLNLSNLEAKQSVVDQESQFGILNQTNPTQCCKLRKVEPLFAGLEPYDTWFTALRRDQSPTRANLQEVEPFKLTSGKIIQKVSPLADWTSRDVYQYMQAHGIPELSLYDLGYTSIGCKPCTKLPLDPNDPRSGRWQGQGKLECGIHIQEK